jgi:hypothetical protein
MTSDEDKNALVDDLRRLVVEAAGAPDLSELGECDMPNLGAQHVVTAYDACIKAGWSPEQLQARIGL